MRGGRSNSNTLSSNSNTLLVKEGESSRDTAVPPAASGAAGRTISKDPGWSSLSLRDSGCRNFPPASAAFYLLQPSQVQTAEKLVPGLSLAHLKLSLRHCMLRSVGGAQGPQPCSSFSDPTVNGPLSPPKSSFPKNPAPEKKKSESLLKGEVAV